MTAHPTSRKNMTGIPVVEPPAGETDAPSLREDAPPPAAVEPKLQMFGRSVLHPFRRALARRLPLEWDAPTDTAYAHKAPGFERVLHVFNRQWIGIRAAAGSLPGHKLAVDGKLRLSRSVVNAVTTGLAMRGIERVVFHGMSGNLQTLIGALAAAGLSRHVYLVYHGSVAQWCDAPERRLAFMAFEAAAKGHVHRLHIMKGGHDLLPGVSFTPLLLNMAPVTGLTAAERDGDRTDVLLPGTDAWCKNTHGNALAAAMTPQVTRVLHHMRGLALPQPFAGKLQHVPFVDRPTTLELMSAAAATAYASLVECHPMVNLESEAVGTPCIRNALALDALEDHPYVRLVEVPDRASPRAISQTLFKVLSVPRDECQDLIRDYHGRLHAISLARYREFLEL